MSETITETIESTPEGANTQEPAGNREARYRVERNEARTALAEAESRIEALQLREVERLAGDLAQPKDLLELGGVTLSDFITPEGWVDREAVAHAVAELIESRPGLARNPKDRPVDLTQGLGNAPGKPKIGWGDLFKD